MNCAWKPARSIASTRRRMKPGSRKRNTCTSNPTTASIAARACRCAPRTRSIRSTSCPPSWRISRRKTRGTTAKTNQFNLTTRRYTSGEVEAIAQDPAFITLYGRLADRFGNNGLVSVLIGQVSDETIQLDLWLMSCRVMKREMEFAMFDALVEQCQARGIRKIVGVYIPSKKNSMVAGHYASLGFIDRKSTRL